MTTMGRSSSGRRCKRSAGSPGLALCRALRLRGPFRAARRGRSVGRRIARGKQLLDLLVELLLGSRAGGARRLLRRVFHVGRSVGQITHASVLLQARSKSIQTRQSLAKLKQGAAKEKAWIALDRLGGIEPFQWVAPTAGAKRSSPAPFPAGQAAPDGGSWATKPKIARFLIFASKIQLALQERSRLRPGDALALTPLATLALARRGALGGGAFQFAALAFGRHALGCGLFAMGLGMGAEVAP